MTTKEDQEDSVEMQQVKKIQEWYNAFRGHQFRCVPENAKVFERTVEEMRGHIRTLLQIIDSLRQAPASASELATTSEFAEAIAAGAIDAGQGFDVVTVTVYRDVYDKAVKISSRVTTQENKK